MDAMLDTNFPCRLLGLTPVLAAWTPNEIRYFSKSSWRQSWRQQWDQALIDLNKSQARTCLVPMCYRQKLGYSYFLEKLRRDDEANF